ncbi:MAG TPA: anthranilate synthase component I family protein, partial [Pyrinomonadaceae bacterium]
PPKQRLKATSNFTREEYLTAIETIKERIRAGDTYQTNLTQQISVDTMCTRPQDVFWRLRRNHPAPFASFIRRGDSTVVSASPERFFRVTRRANGPHVSKDHVGNQKRRGIETSPIKGTRRRGPTPDEDAQLKHDLLTSSKDRAENTMIVDLLRNDLGRVCEYGSVRVDKLCEIEEHPTLFHLVSTITGDLCEDASFADATRALFPCGSITGAPKISTMRIVEELEPTPRGLSMGAIGYSIPAGIDGLDPMIDLSVAIRTMVFRDGVATFNVGGGITIDSDPVAEYKESLLKAQALLSALNAKLETS